MELGFYVKPGGGGTISLTLLEAVWLPVEDSMGWRLHGRPCDILVTKGSLQRPCEKVGWELAAMVQTPPIF